MAVKKQRSDEDAIGEEEITVAQFAGMHGMFISSVLRLLCEESVLPQAERRLPGARKIDRPGKWRGEWRIPCSEAKAFKPKTAGRPGKRKVRDGE